jgi:hypothetical protein
MHEAGLQAIIYGNGNENKVNRGERKAQTMRVKA